MKIRFWIKDPHSKTGILPIGVTATSRRKAMRAVQEQLGYDPIELFDPEYWTGNTWRKYKR